MIRQDNNVIDGKYPVIWISGEYVQGSNDKQSWENFSGNYFGVCTYAMQLMQTVASLLLPVVGIRSVTISTEPVPRCSAAEHCQVFDCPLNRTTRESYCEFLNRYMFVKIVTPDTLGKNFGKTTSFNRQIDWTVIFQELGENLNEEGKGK